MITPLESFRSWNGKYSTEKYLAVIIVTLSCTSYILLYNRGTCIYVLCQLQEYIIPCLFIITARPFVWDVESFNMMAIIPNQRETWRGVLLSSDKNNQLNHTFVAIFWHLWRKNVHRWTYMYIFTKETKRKWLNQSPVISHWSSLLHLLNVVECKWLITYNFWRFSL